MNREDIIRMAREANINKDLERFAALVAAHEREACAKVCEAIERNGAWVTKQEAAAAIRARGEQ